MKFQAVNTAMIALAMTVSAAAQAAGSVPSEIVCRQPNVADTGFLLTIMTSPVDGAQVARLDRQTFAGAQPVAQFAVGSSTRESRIEFQGPNFKLEIDRARPADARGITRVAHVVAELNGARISQDLLCRVAPVRRSLSAPADRGASMTCMAFWTGFVFDGTRCIQRSGSGCSNPFPFPTLQACQNFATSFSQN